MGIASPVLSKRNFVKRYAAGEFGNRPPIWLTLDEFLASNYRDPVHLRNRIAGGPTWYDIPAKKVEMKWFELISAGVDPKNLYISPMGPQDQERGLQGEVCRGLWGMDLTYTTVKAPMREAMERETRHASGVTALWLLRKYLCPASYDWLADLLDRYVDHVVEFTTYMRQWGVVSGYNTVFWEVRKY